MIPVVQAPEPEDFETEVRLPGTWAIAEMTGCEPRVPRTRGRPLSRLDREIEANDGTRRRVPITKPEDLPASAFPNYWTRAQPDLMRAYRDICAYSCFSIHRVTGAGTVDHMAPKSRAWNRVYEWDNYRLACAPLNSRKRDFEDVLDPFDVETGWFELRLPFFRVVPGSGLADPVRRSVLATIERLDLNGDTMCESRQRDALYLWKNMVSHEFLRLHSPFVAGELARQGHLQADPEWLSQLPDPDFR